MGEMNPKMRDILDEADRILLEETKEWIVGNVKGDSCNHDGQPHWEGHQTKLEPIKRYHIQEMPQPVEWNETNPAMEIVRRYQAIAMERAAMEQDNEICRACIEAAREAGVTDLFLVDKYFVAEAIREKLERMKPDETAESEEALP